MRTSRTSNRRECDVLLIHPPWFRLQGSTLVPYPVGPCYVAAILERAGLNPLVWNGDFDPEAPLSIGGTNILKTDEMVKAHSTYLARLEDSHDPIWSEVKEIVSITKPKVVGISAYSASFRSAVNCARIIKADYPDIPIVLGGIHGTVSPEECLRNCDALDVVMLGEVELSAPPLFSALVQGMKGPEVLATFQGIAYRDGGRIHCTKPAQKVDDLDTVPFPARHLLIDLDKMPPHAHQAIYGFRGCPFKCIFCGSFNVFGRKPRMRSARSLVEEMEMVHRDYGTRYFYICDDIFLLRTERAKEFCERLKEKKLPVYYSIQSRGEMLDEELLDLLKQTGCQHIAIGVEVGDEQIRALIKKGNTLDDMRRAAYLIRKHKLRMVGFFMFGFPWETEEQMIKTADFMEELKPCIAFPYIVTPAPGTELMEIALSMGLIDPSMDLSSFSHISPKMGLTVAIPEERRKFLIDTILDRFARYNRKSLRWDLFTRPLFYAAAARDAGIVSSPAAIVKYVRALFR